MALAVAKLTLVLLLKHIALIRLGSQTSKSLIYMVAAYTIFSLLLVGFQCQLPQPWILRPNKCSTHGTVYYPITVSNMLTDSLLAFWTFPVIWRLTKRRDTRFVVMWSLGSRLLICVMDVVRMVVIHRALQSEDQTRKIPCRRQ